MCGIVGVARFDGQFVAETLLHSMAARLEHRGPDDEGYWVDGSVGFGHRRLSIIDVAGSHQPMATPDGRFHLTFNGEIFNYQELRGRLKYPFRTGGDTETILATHVARGANAPNEFNGQFAYALHDRHDGSILLVRDRLGVLPLYYVIDDQRLAFASEVKALIPALSSPLSVDQRSLGDYLAHRSVPAPFTLFAGVRKLPQGHSLRVAPDGTTDSTRYWSIPSAGSQVVTDERAVAMVSDALEQSVEAALVADVPVGAYLSGGVDSSLIVALVRRARGASGVETFSAGFVDSRSDELPYAREVSRYLGTSHHEVIVSPQDFLDLWHRLTWHRDAPISEPADVAVFRLAELARQHVKVVLSGEGSDELFGGYPKYRYARWAQVADVVPAGVRQPFFTALQRLLPRSATRPRVLVRALAASTATDRLESWFAPFTVDERIELLGNQDRHGQAAVTRAEGDVVRRMLFVDCHGWLAENLLERGDRMSMAASLELRPPFLDHRVVELAFALPSRVKVRRGQTKWVVKQVARQYLPETIVDRRKVGFRVPLDAWFRDGLQDMAWDLLLGPQSFVGDVTDSAVLRALLESHRSGRRNEEIRIWTLLCLEIWHQVFFRATSRPS